MNSITIQNRSRLMRPPAGFEQELLFTLALEEVCERNKNVSVCEERRVKIVYLGEIHQLHKYQVACVHTNTSRKGIIEYAADVLTKINTVFSILVVSTDDAGMLVKLHNFPYLQQKWATLRSQLLQDYTEELFITHISDMDVLMSAYESVLLHLQSAEMYGLYFNGYHRSYSITIPVNHTAVYGKSCNSISVKENITGSFRESAIRQLAELHIIADEYERAGICRYIDGVLEHCRKEIIVGKKTITYSVVWIGLKKLFQ